MDSDLFDALVRMVHIIAAAVFVGPQVLLAAAMPGIRSVEDARSRQQLTRHITTWYGILGGAALAVLLATGTWNLIETPYFESRFERYYAIMQVKLTLVTIVVILTVLHGAMFGRRLQVLLETGAPEAEIARARRWSMMASMLTLALSLAILVCAGLLGSVWSIK